MNTTTAEKWMRRVLAMLAKAEATDSPEEAETFFGKAQELIAAHGIEEAELARLGRHADGTAMGSEPIEIPGSYKISKTSILGAVALHNGVVVTRTAAGRDMVVTITGRESDRAIVIAMFASTLTAAERHLAAATIPDGESTRSFRNAFFLGFAGRLDEKLEAANAAVEAESESTAIVATDRLDDARRYLTADGSRFRKARSRSSSRAGHSAGRTAADGTNLNRSMTAGSRRALNS